MKRLVILAAALLAALLPAATAAADVDVTPRIDGHVQDVGIDILGIPLGL